SYHECLTVMIRFCQFIEDHCNPRISPCRMPVRNASSIMVRKSPSACSSSSSHSPWVRKSVLGGGLFNSLIFGVGVPCHSLAQLRHLPRTVRRLLTVLFEIPFAICWALYFSMRSVVISSKRIAPKNGIRLDLRIFSFEYCSEILL